MKPSTTVVLALVGVANGFPAATRGESDVSRAVEDSPVNPINIIVDPAIVASDVLYEIDAVHDESLRARGAQTTCPPFIHRPGAAAAETTSIFLGCPGIFKKSVEATKTSADIVNKAAQTTRPPFILPAGAAETTSTFLGSPGIFKASETTSTFLGSPGIFKAVQTSSCPPFIHTHPNGAVETNLDCPGIFKRDVQTSTCPPFIHTHPNGAVETNLDCPGIFKRAVETGAPTVAAGVFPPASYYWLAGSSSAGIIRNLTSSGTVQVGTISASGLQTTGTEVVTSPYLNFTSTPVVSSTDAPILAPSTPTRLAAFSTSVYTPPCPNGLTVTVTVVATNVLAAPSVVKNVNLTATESSFIASQTAATNGTVVTATPTVQPSATGAVGATGVNLAFLVGFAALAILF